MMFVSTFQVKLESGEIFTPCEVVVCVKNGLLRSGPEEKYYPTRVLEKGDRLEVYRVIDDQWYGVRPPQGSFSWVDARFVQLLGKGDVGMIIQDNVHARIGSELGNMCGATNVWLNKGDRIAIYERIDTPSDPETPTWYKIAPPAGEFRWVHKDHIRFEDTQVDSDPPKPLYAYPRKNRLKTEKNPIIQVSDNQGEVALELTMEDFRLVLNDLKLEFSDILINDPPNKEDRLESLVEEAQILYESAPTTLEQEEIKSLLAGVQKVNRNRSHVSQMQPVYLDERSTSDRQIVMPMEESSFQPYYEIDGVRYYGSFDPSGMMPSQVRQPNMQYFMQQQNQVSRQQQVPQKKRGGLLAKLGLFTSQNNIAEKQPENGFNVNGNFRQMQQQGAMLNNAQLVLSPDGQAEYVYFDPEVNAGIPSQAYSMMQPVEQPITVQSFARQQSPRVIMQQTVPQKNHQTQAQVVPRSELQFSAESPSEFDVIGRLGRVKGTQTYAIEDDNGRQYLVTPPRGVNLENYLADVVGKVGISGQRGILQDSGIPHISISSAPQVIPQTNRK